MAKKKEDIAEEMVEEMTEVDGVTEEVAGNGAEAAADTSNGSERGAGSGSGAGSHPDAKWYVVHTYSGYENKVEKSIRKTIANRRMEDRIFDVRVPMISTYDMKDGARKSVQKKMYPGYVLINMIMTDETWYIVRNTRGVTGFVGPGSKPVPLNDYDIEPQDSKQETINIDFGEGDSIEIIAGIWEGTKGIVTRLDMGKQTATINVDLFGRATPVEISFSDVRKML